MTLIPCSERCIHQAEGMCTLSSASEVTNIDGRGCIHRVRPETPMQIVNRPEHRPHL
ncbi:MAG: hypothetical protein IJU51_07115 [Clostridia bacterium]|nr:hypothetical protein [Clostridia bacterium]